MLPGALDLVEAETAESCQSEVREARVDAHQFVYRAAGGASLRYGVMQLTYREMLTAGNHFTINPNIIGAADCDIAALRPGGISAV